MRSLDTELTIVSDQTIEAHQQQQQHWNLSPPSPSALTQPLHYSDSASDAATHTDEDIVLPDDDAVSRFNETSIPSLYTAKPVRTCSAFSVCGSGQQQHSQLPLEPQPKISSAGLFDPTHPLHSHSLLFAVPPPQPPSECIVPTPHHAVPIYPAAAASLLNLSSLNSSGPGSSLHIGFNRELANPNYNMAALINAPPPPPPVMLLPTPPLPSPLTEAVMSSRLTQVPAPSSATTAAASSVTASNEVESDEDYNDAEAEAEAEEEEEPETHSRSTGGGRRKRSRNASSDHTRTAHVLTDRQRRAKIKAGMDSLKRLLSAQGMLGGSGQQGGSSGGGADQASVTLGSVRLLEALTQELRGMHSAFSAALQEIETVRSTIEPVQPQLAQRLSQRLQQLNAQRQQIMYEATQTRLCGASGNCGKMHQSPSSAAPSAPTAVASKRHHPPGHGRAHQQPALDSPAAAAGVYPYAPQLKMEQ